MGTYEGTEEITLAAPMEEDYEESPCAGCLPGVPTPQEIDNTHHPHHHHQVDEFCVKNNAGFDILLSLKNLNHPEAQAVGTPDMYPAPQTGCVSAHNLDQY